MKIQGKSLFSLTTRPNTKGKFPSNCYEVGVTDIEIVEATEDEKKFLKSFFKEHLKDVDIKDEQGNITSTVKSLKIGNSKYEIPMFDMNANRLDHSVPLANGTNIKLAIEQRFSETYNTDYLVVKAIQVLDEIKEFNPFA